MPAQTAPTPPAERLIDRARAPRGAEQAAVPWLLRLTADERDRALSDLRVAEIGPGEHLCRVGRPVTYWFGVIEGLLKMSNDTAQGVPIIFTGIPAGGWFGEGTCIKRETYRYNVLALRRSVVAGLGVETFHWLLDRSIGFNRFVLQQLNERLAQFIGAREIDRISDPESRVARSLAALFHPLLYPGVGGALRVTQQELAYLVGLSRQRVNEALKTLQAAGLIGVDYGGLRVLDLDGLRRYRRA